MTGDPTRCASPSSCTGASPTSAARASTPATSPKALVELGHHVEVFSGPPYPELDERVPLHRLPEPRPLPGAPTRSGSRSRGSSGPGSTSSSSRSCAPPASPSRGRSACGPRRALRTGATTSTWCTTTSASAPACSASSSDGPAGARHDPPPDHRRPPGRAGPRPERRPAPDAPPLVRLHPHADAGGPPPRRII